MLQLMVLQSQTGLRLNNKKGIMEQVLFKTDFEASLVAQVVKNLPAMQETQAQSLSQDDPLEEGIGNPLSVLAWRIPWTEEPGGLQSMGLQRVGHDKVTNTFTFRGQTSYDTQSSAVQLCLEIVSVEIMIAHPYTGIL